MRIQTRIRSLGFVCAGNVPEDSCGAAALRCAARYVVSLQNWPCSLFKPHNESCSRKSMMCSQRHVYRHMLIDAYAYTHTQSSQHLRRQHICIQLLCINARTLQHMCENVVRVYQRRDTVSCASSPRAGYWRHPGFVLQVHRKLYTSYAFVHTIMEMRIVDIRIYITYTCVHT